MTFAASNSTIVKTLLHALSSGRVAIVFVALLAAILLLAPRTGRAVGSLETSVATGVIEVSAGGRHTCAIEGDGSVVCWGEPFGGKLSPPAGLVAVQLSAGANHTCAVTAAGEVACWGRGDEGQTSVPAGLVARQVSSGLGHSCAVTVDDEVVCWGALADDEGQADVPSGLTGIEAVVAGGQHTCALHWDDSVTCWGTNFNGQLEAPGGLAATQISGRYLHTCVLRSDGAPTCWGYGPIAATPAGIVADQISAGSTHTCVVNLDAIVECWGFFGEPLPEPQQDYGQTLVPEGLGAVLQVSAGHYHTCAVRTNGTVVCWGRDIEGQTEVPEDLREQADEQPPTIACVSPDGAWHGSDVALACTASDEGSGLVNPGDANFVLVTNVGDGADTANAATGLRTVCDNADNCATAGPIAGNKVDKKAPTITLTAPAATAYGLNQIVNAAFGCADLGSGLGSCAGTTTNASPITTSAVGPHTFTVTATDAVGNSATTSVTYTVRYQVCTLFDQTKAHRSGSTIPIKLQLCDASGANVSGASTSVVATSVYQVSNNAPGPLDDSGNANPDLQFRFDADKYIFNLSLMGFSQGTYALTFTAGGDPTVHTVTFQVR